MNLIKLILLMFPLILLAKEATVKQLFSVQTVKVKKEQRSKSRENYGFVKADESRIYDISPRFGGYVMKLYADTIYTKVKKGEALVELYSPEVFKAKEEYLNSYNFTRQRANASMLASAKLKLKLLGIIDQEISKVTHQESASKSTTIYSPVDGYLFAKSINQGSAFNSKSKLFQIVNLDRVWVEVKLYEEDRLWLNSTQKYEISFKGVEKRYSATKAFLYPNLDKNEATLTLRISVDNEDNTLFPGMYATISSLAQTASYLTLPSSAVMRKNAQYYVFVAGEYEGEYEPHEVNVTRFDNNTYVIHGGVSEGDEVVNNALFMMDSDAQINGLY